MKIRNKMVLFTLLLVSIPYILGMFGILTITKKGITSMSLSTLEKSVVSISNSFSSFFTQKLQYAKSLSALPAAKNMDWPEIKKVLDLSLSRIHSHRQHIRKPSKWEYRR